MSSYNADFEGCIKIFVDGVGKLDYKPLSINLLPIVSEDKVKLASVWKYLIPTSGKMDCH